MEFNTTIIHIIGNLNYIIMLMAFLTRKMLYLRILAIVSSIFAIIYFSIVATDPLWVPIGWKGAMIVANIMGIIYIIYQHREIQFRPEEKKLYKAVFATLAPLQFKKLLDIGVFTDVEEGEHIVHKNTKIEELILLSSGKVKIISEGKLLNYCESGAFIGEMSFLTNNPTTADVIAIEPTRYLKWMKKDFQRLLQKDRKLKTSLHNIFNVDLLKKLAGTAEQK
jgi:hypothetical protein